jgi:hypothetical protein
MLDAGCWMLDAGCWMLDAGCWMLDAGCWMLDAGCWMLGCWDVADEVSQMMMRISRTRMALNSISAMTFCGL